MTTLAEVLTGPVDAAVLRVAATVTPAAVERTAVRAGWRFALVDGTGAAGKTEALERFRAGLGLPAWFGHNLDALVDALRDVADEPGLVLLWDGVDAFAAAEPGRYEAVLDVLAQRAGDADRPGFVPVVRAVDLP